MSDPAPNTEPDKAASSGIPVGGETSPLVIMELIQRLKIRDVMTRNLVTLTREEYEALRLRPSMPQS